MVALWFLHKAEPDEALQLTTQGRGALWIAWPAGTPAATELRP